MGTDGFLRLGTVVVVAAALAGVAAACVGDDPATTQGLDAGGSPDGSSGSSGDAGLDGFVLESCSPGQVRCESAQLEVCNAGGTGYLIAKVCDTPELCQARSGQDCAPAACAVAASRCSSADFEKCNPGRTGFDKQRTCGSPVLCVPDGGADGGCIPPACAPSEKHCDSTCTLGGGASAEDCIKTCKTDLTGYSDTVNCGTAQHMGLSDSCTEPSAGNPVCQ